MSVYVNERLSMKDKCETLFGTSYRDGDGVSKNSFQSFAGGLCINQDYSDLIKEFDSEEERFIGEDS